MYIKKCNHSETLENMIMSGTRECGNGNWELGMWEPGVGEAGTGNEAGE
jgi:hypothetical protein